jgi:hypothetical protein
VIFHLKTKVKIGIITIAALIVGTTLWQYATNTRQSTIRLRSKLSLEELAVSIENYRKIFHRVPHDLEELRSVGLISNISNFDAFTYVGGFRGILAYQKEPFAPVDKGEPWGGNGEVAKNTIPSSRLLFFNDGSIKFIEEAEFHKTYRWLKGVDKYNTSGADGVTRELKLELVELIPGMDLSKWYRQESGYDPDSKWFGGYTTLAVDNELYIGFGTGLPTLGDGALIARFDGEGLDVIGSLAEEGIHEMIWDERGGTLHIAGTDPSWPDDWSAGNHYTYVRSGPKKIAKHRDPQNGLVNVIHTWGLWLSDDQVLYAAVNSHDGNFTRDRNVLRLILNRINSIFDAYYYSTDYGVTRKGQIFKSTDNGVSWRYISDVGDFRAYDIIGFDDKLYAIYTDAPELPCKLAVSEDGGKRWRDVAQSYLQRIHLTKFEGNLLTVSHDGESIFAVGENTFNRYDLPEKFRVESNFNVLAVTDRYLYAICKEADGYYSILRTPDLHQWERVVRTNKKLISLSHWQDRNWLIISSVGVQAKLYKVDLNKTSMMITNS